MNDNAPSLFDPRLGIVGADHPDTSRIAAVRVMPRTGTQRRRVLDYISKTAEVGATDIEMQEALGMSGNTQRPRRIELVEAGLVKDSGRRRHQNRPMIVWVVA